MQTEDERDKIAKYQKILWVDSLRNAIMNVIRQAMDGEKHTHTDYDPI